jgi:hypothetical protein
MKTSSVLNIFFFTFKQNKEKYLNVWATNTSVRKVNVNENGGSIFNKFRHKSVNRVSQKFY